MLSSLPSQIFLNNVLLEIIAEHGDMQALIALAVAVGDAKLASELRERTGDNVLFRTLRAKYLSTHLRNLGSWQDRAHFAWVPAIQAVAKSIVPHGGIKLKGEDGGYLWPRKDALEVVRLCSVASNNGGRRVLFVRSYSDQNVCDVGCWCASLHSMSMTAILPGAEKNEAVRLFVASWPGGEAAGFNGDFVEAFAAPEAAQVKVAAAMGINPMHLGVLLRAVGGADVNTRVWAEIGLQYLFEEHSSDEEGGDAGWKSLLRRQSMKNADEGMMCFDYLPTSEPTYKTSGFSRGVTPYGLSPRDLLKHTMNHLISKGELAIAASRGIYALHNCVAGWGDVVGGIVRDDLRRQIAEGLGEGADDGDPIAGEYVCKRHSWKL